MLHFGVKLAFNASLYAKDFLIMARQKLTTDQVMAEVNAVWPVGQNEVTAEAIRSALDAAGKSNVNNYLHAAKRDGKFIGYVRLNEDGTVTHMYRKAEG